MNTLPDELQAKIRAATKAAIDAHYAPLIERKRRELQDLEVQHQQALEKWLLGEMGGNGSVEVSPLSQGTQNGTSRAPTRRAMVLAVLPDFRNQDFIRRDIEARILEKWPEAEPKTERESKNFTSAIAALMTDLVEKGRLESTEGESPFAPRTYRLKADSEDTLLKSGP